MNSTRIAATSPGPRVAFYDGYERWKRWEKLFQPTREEVDYFVGETRGLKIQNGDVLEIGFGAGSFLAWAKKKGARVCGTEINPLLIEGAREFGVEVLPADFQQVAPAHAGRFDTIVAFDVFEHFSLDEIVTRLRAVDTMLKPSGHLVLRFPNAQSPFGLAPQNGDPTHISALSRSVFEQLIQGTSFAIVRYSTAFRIGSSSPLKWTVRKLRYLARDLIAWTLNAIYAQNIPWDPVVVLVLRRH